MKEEIYEQMRNLAGNPALRFSDEMNFVYRQMMESFQQNPETKGYINYTPHNLDLGNIRTPVEVAAEMYIYFHAHFFKFQQAILSREHEIDSASPFTPSIFDKPHLTILDIGTGVGTVPLAIIDLLRNYQRAKVELGYTPFVINLNFILVEPNKLKHQVIDELLNQYQALVYSDLINISQKVIGCCFSDKDCLNEILSADVCGSTLLISMSCFLYWVSRKYQDLEPIIEDLKQITENTEYDSIGVLCVEPKEYKKEDVLPEELIMRILYSLENRLVSVEERQFPEIDVQYENPARSYYREKDNIRYGPNPFHFGYLSHIKPSSKSQESFAALVELDKLKSSWVKALHTLRLGFVEDLIESKLFESQYEQKLAHLRSLMAQNVVLDYNLDFDVSYDAPKSPSTNRPMMFCRLENQIALVALSQVIGEYWENKFDELKVSYGNRLCLEQNEYFYKYWLTKHREYMSDVRQRLDEGMGLCSSDIKSFYPHINQNKLIDKLRDNLLKSESKLENFCETLLKRACHGSDKSNSGLPQGGVTSGFFANVYLQSFDQNLLDQFADEKHTNYHRYVDDISLLYNQNITVEEVKENLRVELDKLDIEINPQKTRHGTKDDFQTFFELDQELNILSKEFGKLIKPFYYLDTEYYNAYQADWQSFLRLYQLLLKGIGFHSSTRWLDRRLQQELGWRQKWVNIMGLNPFIKWFKSTVSRSFVSIDFPPFPTASDFSEIEAWALEFESQNVEWIKLKSDLTGQLLSLLGDSLNALENSTSQDEKKKYLKRVRFTVFRLGILRNDAALSIFKEILLEKPWLVNLHLLTRALANYEAEGILLEGLNHSHVFVRAKCAWGLGEMKSQKSVVVLVNILDSDATPLERLMASETLVKIDSWEHVSMETILRLWNSDICPYLLKNIAMIISRAKPENYEEILKQRLKKSEHQIVIDAIYFALNNPDKNIAFLPEPELRSYYSEDYPDLEDDPAFFGIYSS